MVKTGAFLPALLPRKGDELTAEGQQTFASPDSNHTQDHGLVVPLQPFAAKDRPLTSLSISDYGDYFSDDKVAPSHAHADSGSADEHAHQGHSTSIDVQSQTPTPRRATFGRDANVVLNGPGVALSSSGAAGVGAAVGATAGRQPVRYGYL